MIRSGIRTGSRIMVLFLLVLALLFGGLIWFDFLGIMNARDAMAPILSIFNARTRTQVEDLQNIELLEDQRAEKQFEALVLRSEELDQREEAIIQKEAEIEQIVESLEELEKVLEEREKSFNEKVNQYENKNANLEQTAKYLVGMPPASAVEILSRMEDQDIIDLLRVTERLAQAAGEDSIVSYWLSLMDPERAATLQRKMVKKP